MLDNSSICISFIGGKVELINYVFREMTYNIDAIIRSSSVMKEAINAVGDRLGLPVGWLNTDFTNTDSYTSKLVEYSKFYKKFLIFYGLELFHQSI